MKIYFGVKEESNTFQKRYNCFKILAGIDGGVDRHQSRAEPFLK
jgi:hypothetical protein